MAGPPVEVSHEQEQRERNEEEPNGGQPVENPAGRVQQGEDSVARRTHSISHTESQVKGDLSLGRGTSTLMRNRGFVPRDGMVVS